MSVDARAVGRAAWQSVWPFLPGAVIVLTIYAATVARGGRFLFEERFLVMQALDPRSLGNDPIPSLLSLHTQPPMMNTLYALTDSAPERLGWIMLAATFLTTLLVVDTVRASGRGDHWAAAAGAFYALLPATVLYSLFPYSTTVTALFAIVTLWGVGRIRTWNGIGVAVSAMGMGGLFLTRASFAWWVALGWLLALAVLAARARWHALTRGVAIATLAIVGAGVVSVQAHYWAAFRVPTLSSWSGENLSNALIEVGLSDEAKASLAAEDPCFAQLIAARAWGPTELYGPCLDPADEVKIGTPVLALVERPAPSMGINYNAGARLGLADDWVRFARAAVIAEPAALLRVVLGNTEFEGSLARFLGRSDVYFETLDIQKASTPWLWNVLALWSAAFPVLAWLVVVAASARGIVQRASRGWLPREFWFAAALLFLHAVPSVIGDYGENQRFRAELDPVLVVAMVLGLGVLVTVRRTNVESSPSAE
jgi:hypothetical protein